ncbi:MAG: CHAT domain-containing protein [Isosphaeraceae bacterium]
MFRKLVVPLFGALVLIIPFPVSGQAPAIKPSTGQPPAPGLLKPTGDDEKRAKQLDEQIDKALKADRWGDAIGRAEEVLALRTRAQGPKHFETVSTEWRLKTLRGVAPMAHEDRVAYQSAGTMNEQAETLYAQGKYAQAQPLDENALSIRRRLLTDDHPDTAKSYGNLAYNLNAQGKYVEARERWQSAMRSLDAVRLRLAFTGMERAGAEWSSRSALATVLVRLGQPVEAWQPLEEDLGRGLLDELAARQDRRLAPGERARLRELTAELERLDRLVEANPKGLDQAERAKRFEDDLRIVAEGAKPVPVEVWRDSRSFRQELAPGKLGVFIDPRPAPEAIAEQRKLQQVLVAARSGGERFAPLPGTRYEVEALAQLFKSDDRPTRALLGTDASESELDRLAASGDLGRFAFIHLATHGVIDEAIPQRSAVILTQTGLPDPLEQVRNHKPVFDGRLSVREIQRNWDLKAELVTLSACETALGPDAGGEGFVGFTQALLMSGARGVCLSLWKEDDKATSLLG